MWAENPNFSPEEVSAGEKNDNLMTFIDSTPEEIQLKEQQERNQVLLDAIKAQKSWDYSQAANIVYKAFSKNLLTQEQYLELQADDNGAAITKLILIIKVPEPWENKEA